MAIAIHRDTDSRNCGAKTTVTGQGTVYANELLVSVNADPNDHGAGNLTAACNEVYVNGKLVVIVGNSASEDNLCKPDGGNHCNPKSSSGSGNVFVGG